MFMGKVGQKAAAFINHKPFHPGNFANVEKVWLAEEKHKEDLQKQQELEQARNNERRIEELRKVLQTSDPTIGRTNERMTWMYENPAEAQKQREQEAFLLGKKIEETPEQKPTFQRIDAKPENLFVEDLKVVTEDTVRKIREDPLFLIKQAEHNHRKALLNNPLTREKVLRKEAEEQRAKEIVSTQGELKWKLVDEIAKLKTKIAALRKDMELEARDDRKSRRRRRSSRSRSPSRSRRDKPLDASKDRRRHRSRGSPARPSRCRERFELTEEQRAARLNAMQTDARKHQRSQRRAVVAAESKQKVLTEMDSLKRARDAHYGTSLPTVSRTSTLEQSLRSRAAKIDRSVVRD
ncbi:MAG: hypothetical protein KVP17_002357 [Porospora cf. gigantea B]|uniref:uncharacterized protein n=1 Tax=Porospora cf. gigantea B TaxID=2853592 RepID=UPI003571CCB8|nr:MAG: hypothetical protein KVP17_002357 [Porospora cf. gigantea B]